MNSVAAQWLEAEKQRHAHALGLYGDKLVIDIRASIGEPYPPASSPGRPPHLRTGALQSGVSHSVNEFADKVILTLVSERDPQTPHDTNDVPMILEFGGGRIAPRPYMRPSMDQVQQDGVAPILENL